MGGRDGFQRAHLDCFENLQLRQILGSAMLGGAKNVTLPKNRFKVEIAICGRARNATHRAAGLAGNLDPQVAMQGNEDYKFGLGKVFCDV